MTTFNVHHADGSNDVFISLDGFEVGDTKNIPVVGSFEFDIDPETNQVKGSTLASSSAPSNGDHPYVREARRILEDDGTTVTDNFNFIDQASNAPVHSESAGDALASDDLPSSEPGTDPEASNQKGGERSTAGTKPSETKPNGVQKTEGTDAKEAKASEQK